jgi:transcriptional regulator with XRE-family HTH domain
MSSSIYAVSSYHAPESRAVHQLVAWASLPTASLVLMIGEVEQRERFAYALQRALRARGMSERELAKQMEIDPRRVARWRAAKDVPNLFEAARLAQKLGVSEELFRSPPPVPDPPPEPYYPIERYLTDAIAEGGARGLRDEGPSGQADDEPDEQRQPPHPRGR